VPSSPRLTGHRFSGRSGLRASYKYLIFRLKCTLAGGLFRCPLGNGGPFLIFGLWQLKSARGERRDQASSGRYAARFLSAAVRDRCACSCASCAYRRISRLASRRRSLCLCGGDEPHKLQCREAKGQNQQPDDDFESGHGASLKAIFQWVENNLRHAIGVCPGSQNGRLSAGQSSGRSSHGRLALIFNPIFRRYRVDQRRFPREPKMI
jgi:hypothetical protein